MKKVVGALAKVYHDKKVDCRIDLSLTLALRADEGDLMELFGNLLDNASKWCERRVAISAHPSKAYVTIHIDDNGPGYPLQLAKRFTVRGVRADVCCEGQEIGLSVTDEIVRAHEGEISLEEFQM